MSPKEQAILDIKNDLRQQGKSFLAFHKELNPVMDSLVNSQLKAQELQQK